MSAPGGASAKSSHAAAIASRGAISRVGSLVLAFALLGTLVPFVVADFPPSTDLPQHLAQIRLVDELLGFAPPSPMSAEPIALNLLAPGNLVYGPLWLLTRALPPVVAGRAVLFLLAALHVIVAFRVASSRGRAAGAALWASLFAFNLNLYWGFLGFLLGAPLLVLWVDVVSRLASPPRLRETVKLSGLALALYGAHSICFLVAVLWLAIATLRSRPSARVALYRASALVPTAVLAALWYPKLALIRESGGYDLGAHWLVPPWERLDPRWIADAALGGLRGPTEPAVFLVCAAWLVLGAATHRKSPAFGFDRALLGAAGFFLLVTLLGPDKYMNTIHVGARFAPVSFALLMLAAPAPRVGRLIATVVPLAAALSFFASTAAAFYAFSASELGGLGAALRAMPRPGAIVGIDLVKKSAVVKGAPFLQLAAYAQAENGSVPAFSFAQHGASIVTYTAPRRIGWTHNLEWYGENVRASDFAHFDYALVVADPPTHGAFSRVFSLSPLTHEGRCRLYATPRAAHLASPNPGN